MASRLITAPFDDDAAAADLARSCDVVTLEIEKIPLATLEAVAAIRARAAGRGASCA